MIKFISITGSDGKKRILNTNYIEEIVEIDNDSCCIYMAFNCPDAMEQDYFMVNQPYEKIVEILIDEQ
jgi:hypothetical protein